MVLYFEGAEDYDLKVTDAEYTPHHEKKSTSAFGGI